MKVFWKTLPRFLFVAIFDQKEVFIVSLHKVLLPGIFLQQCRVGLQLIQFLLSHRNLLFIVLLAFLQLYKLSALPEMTRYKVPGIKEHNPHYKTNRCEEVFVL